MEAPLEKLKRLVKESEDSRNRFEQTVLKELTNSNEQKHNYSPRPSSIFDTDN